MENQQNQQEQLEKALNLLKSKENKIYFLVQDTKGVQRASVATTYEFVKILTDNGYNAAILNEKNDYHGVGEWLGEEYSSLPHVSIESKELSVGPADFLVIPEIFGHVLDQTKEMPCSRIVFCQSYDYVFEMLPPGFTWGMMNVSSVITTGEATTTFLTGVFPNLLTQQINLGIDDYFVPSDKPKMPIVAIHTREPRDTMKIVKSFYVKFPQFKWVTFRDMRGLSKIEFAKALSESCVSIWIDDISGFGTFPLESMKCGSPVIGKIPHLKPDWLTEDNGFWTFDPNQIIDILSSYLKNWLEDAIPVELYGKMADTVKPYNMEDQKNRVLEIFESYRNERTLQLEEQINKLQPMAEVDEIK